jgi:hypothetical protein
MKDCCRREARLHLKKHRDVATCDGCGALVLAYGNETDFRNTVRELESRGLECQAEKLDALWILVKPR